MQKPNSIIGVNSLDSLIPGCPNFKWKEIIKSNIAARCNIDNGLYDQKIVESAMYHAQQKQKIRDLIKKKDVNPAIIGTSWFRSVNLGMVIYNNGECSEAERYALAMKSNHVRGEADDSECLGLSNVEYGILIAEADVPFHELIFEFIEKDNPTTGWIHHATRKGSDKRRIKIKDKNHHYEVVSLEFVKEYYYGRV